MTIDRHPAELKNLIRTKLESESFRILEVSYDSPSDLETLPLEDVDAALLAPARKLPVSAIERLAQCKLMQVWSSGYDKFNITDALDAGIPVANNHGANATSVAEQTMMLMLGVSRRAAEMHTRVVKGDWTGNDHGMSSYSLKGKTLGIIGMGRIGSLVASRALAFEMKVVFFDPHVNQARAPGAVTRVEWNTLLTESDYISLHLHHTDTTRGMLNAEAFLMMARQPFIINASRAELIERSDLINALRTGAIRGLGIDAHYDEPTSENDELWSFPSVFASPHVAGSTLDSYLETIDACIANMNRAMSGQMPEGLIS